MPSCVQQGTNSTSPLRRKAASATESHARVVSRNADEERMRRTSRQCSRSLIAAAVSDTSPRRNPPKPTVQLFLDNREKESLTTYTDGYRAYDPPDDDQIFHRESVIYDDGEYVDGDAHVSTCERRLKGQTHSVPQTIPASATNPS